MYLIYFDENKYEAKSPYFFIGGFLIKDDCITNFESTLMQIQYNFFQTNILNQETELHGSHIFHGKAHYKSKKLSDRIALFENVAKFLKGNKIPIRLICIDVKAHRNKYAYPHPEYNLGLMLMLERFCDFLEEQKEIGLVFGDYEKDEITKSVLDFSQFKHIGKTPMYFGRPLGRLKDTIYFTHSHHSRFLQVADLIVYMANRYENGYNPEKWHDVKLKSVWESIKATNDYKLQRWP